MTNNNKGFTLIELLIVVAIIAILAVILFVALDPLTRLRDSRDSKRAAQASEMLSAIKVDQVDNGGTYATVVQTGATAGQVYMIGTCDGVAADQDATALGCDTVPTQAACLDIESGADDIVTEGYIGGVPQAPDGAIDFSGTYTTMTGYTLEKETSGILRIRACEAENTGEIELSK